MGQYFLPVNVTKKEAIARNVIIPVVEWSEVIGLRKMMETAYTMNSQVMCVLGKLQDEWFGDAIVWAGDYEGEETLESEKRLYHIVDDENSSYRDVTADTLDYAPWYRAETLFEVSHYGKYEIPELTQLDADISSAIQAWYTDKLLVNLDRECYVHLGENSRLTDVSPLPLLTSTRAEGGYIDGGRYAGPNIDLMGAWSGQRLGVLSVSELASSEYAAFEKWNIFFGESAETQTAVMDLESVNTAEDGDAVNPIFAALEAMNKADKQTGEIIRYSDALFGENPAPATNISLKELLAATMLYAEWVADGYWARFRLDRYFTAEQRADARFSKRDLVVISEAFNAIETKLCAAAKIAELLDETRAILDGCRDTMRLNRDVHKYTSLFILEGYELRRDDLLAEVLDFLNDHFAKKVQNTSALTLHKHNFIAAGKEYADTDKLRYAFTPSGYLDALREKLQGRTFEGALNEYLIMNSVKGYERYSGGELFSVSGKVMELSDVLHINKYSLGNADIEARDIAAAATRVIGVVNAVLCREGEWRQEVYVRDFKKCETEDHPFIAAIQIFKKGKCRLTFKNADYAARVASALERQKNEIAA